MTPRKPSSAAFLITSRGYFWASSSSSTCGETSFSAKSRAASRMACCSAVSEKSKRQPPPTRTRACYPAAAGRPNYNPPMDEPVSPERGRRLESEEELAAVVRSMRTIAVVGMKGEDRPEEPAFEIPQRLQRLGFRVLPVNPKLETALGERAAPDLASVAEAFDVVDVFRRPEAIPEVAEAVLALPAERRPRVVWLQSGIRNEAAARRLTAAGIDVVEDRCLGVYAGRYAPR